MSGQTRPVKVITWATETTYPSGSFAGQNTKNPPVGDLFIPGAPANGGTKVPADWLNYLFNAYSGAIQAIQDWAGNAPALNWFGLYAPSTIFGGSGTAVQGVRWEDNSAVRQWLVSGYYNDGVTYHARVYVTGDLGQTWTAAGTGDVAADASGFAGCAAAVDPNNSSNVFAMATGRSGTVTIAKSTSGGAWASSTTISATGFGAVNVCTIGTAICFSYAKVSSGGTAIVSSTNSGTSWSTFTPSVTPAEWLLVSNGSIAIALGVGSSYTTVSGTYYSSTNGTTWTTRSLPSGLMASGDTPTGLAWTVDSTGPCFIMSVTQGSSSDTYFLRSSDGINWTAVASGTVHIFQLYDLAAIGALLIGSGNSGGSSQSGPSRIYFSVDGGPTWYITPAPNPSNQNASSYIGWSRNRLFASDTGFIMGNSLGVRFSFQAGLPDQTF